MTPEQREQALALLAEVKRRHPWRPQPGPQTGAWGSTADIVGFGGAAGGGKTDLACGMSLCKHDRVVIFRREKAQTQGIVQRLTEIVGSTDGYNSQLSVWRVKGVGRSPLIEFGGLDNPTDHQRWQGRAHDLKVLDEVTEIRESQARFVIGWCRTSSPDVQPQVLMTFNPPTTVEGRWVIRFFAPWLDKGHPRPAKPGELRWFSTVGDNDDYELDGPEPFIVVDGAPCYDFDPAEHGAEDIITPKSRTFFPARVTDNTYYMESGYMATLQALPEPLRSQMLKGDFSAGIEDDPYQVIPTAWVEAAVKRWRKPDRLSEMLSMGIDVARGGKDETVIARLHEGMWFDEPLAYPGSETPNGHTVAGLVLSAMRDDATQHLDVIGVGASPYDVLRAAHQPVYGINVSEAATARDKSGMLSFANLRTQLWWAMREALDPSSNTGIALPNNPRLIADLCSARWHLRGKVIQVDSRGEIKDRTGRSPDYASAYLLALIQTPKLHKVPGYNDHKRREWKSYDPFDDLPH